MKKPYNAPKCDKILCPTCKHILDETWIVSKAASISGKKAKHVMTDEQQAKMQAGRKAKGYKRRGKGEA